MTAMQSPSDLDKRIKNIYDHLYGNAAVRTPAGVAREVGKIIRTATFMEGGAGALCAFSFAPEYRRQLLKNDPKAIKQYATNIREQFRRMNDEWKLYDGEGLQLSDNDIGWCCAQLDGIVVSGTKRDVFGDAVEIFRTSWAKQSSGQFFTDGRITHLAMKLLQFDPFAGDDLIDICCGTGGFLLAGLDHIRQLAKDRLTVKDRERKIAEIGLRALHGQEVDPEICDIANASLSTRIGDGKTLIVQRGDSIEPKSFGAGAARKLNEGKHLCAASNPPFGTKITIKDPQILSYYDLAKPDGRSTSPRAPDILLLERNVKMLKPGRGRLAIVIPYQILSGPQTRYIREWILRHTHLEAVVDLPSETFQPHTGTKTSLLVVRRRTKPADDLAAVSGPDIFMSVPKWIGHDRRGHPVYRRTPDGRATNEVLSDIEDVALAFEASLKKGDPTSVHGDSFMAKLSDITSDSELRLNARYYREIIETRHLPKRRTGWKSVRLGDACARIFFPTRFKRNYVEPSDSAVPFLGGANISDLLVDTKKWISRDDPRISELLVRESWILVTRSGTTGIISSVPAAWDGVAMSEHVIRIVPRPDVIPPEWLQAYLRSTSGQRALARGVFGSVIDEITPEFIANLDVPVPNDVTVLRRVVSQIRKAEAARQNSIQEFDSVFADMEGLLAR